MRNQFWQLSGQKQACLIRVFFQYCRSFLYELCVDDIQRSYQKVYYFICNHQLSCLYYLFIPYHYFLKMAKIILESTDNCLVIESTDNCLVIESTDNCLVV